MGQLGGVLLRVNDANGLPMEGLVNGLAPKIQRVYFLRRHGMNIFALAAGAFPSQQIWGKLGAALAAEPSVFQIKARLYPGQVNVVFSIGGLAFIHKRLAQHPSPYRCGGVVIAPSHDPPDIGGKLPVLVDPIAHIIRAHPLPDHIGNRMSQGHRRVADGEDPGIKQLYEFLLCHLDARVLQRVDGVPLGGVRGLDPAEAGIDQRVISAAVKPQELLLHLRWCVIDGKSRTVRLSAPPCPVIVFQRLPAMFQQPCPLLFGLAVVEDLNMAPHSRHGEVVIQIIHGLLHHFLLHPADGQRRQLPGRRGIGGVRHIPGQLRRPLAAV